jgi:hypothetical protein
MKYIVYIIYSKNITGRKANILRRNLLPEHVIDGKVEGTTKVMGRQCRILKQLLEDLQEKKGYCKFKEEALD